MTMLSLTDLILSVCFITGLAGCSATIFHDTIMNPAEGTFIHNACGVDITQIYVLTLDLFSHVRFLLFQLLNRECKCTTVPTRIVSTASRVCSGLKAWQRFTAATQLNSP